MKISQLKEEDRMKKNNKISSVSYGISNDGVRLWKGRKDCK